MNLDGMMLMSCEMLTTLLVVVLIIMKIFGEGLKPSVVMNFVNFSLLLILAPVFLNLPSGGLFGEMFISTPLIVFEKGILVFATLLISLQANNWLKSQKHYIEFYLLLLSVLIGMMLMISTQHFLMFYLGLEMATIPLAALSAFDFNKPRSAEGAGKMILSSAFSSGLLLFGLSLLYGATGSMTFSEVAIGLTISPLLLLSFGFIIAGFAFKISLVPFHFWTADVYEGSPIPVTTFLSVVSKGAAVFIFMTVLYKVFGKLQNSWTPMLVGLSIITMMVGNFFAMRQRNIKRFLAFSSITQAGFILIAIAAASAQSMASVIYFILIYLFSNIAAFTVVSVVSDRTGKEEINDFKGFYKTNPKLSLVMMLALFSLAGIPPTAGFFGKLFLLASGASAGLITLVIIASLNMILSLYYYLRVVKVMFVDHPRDTIEIIDTDLCSKIVFFITVAGILITGFMSGAFEYIHSISFGL